MTAADHEAADARSDVVERPPWAVDADVVVRGLGSDVTTGLTATEAGRRLERDGPNELAETEPTTLLRRFAAQFSDPLVVLLLGVGINYLFVIIGKRLFAWKEGK